MTVNIIDVNDIPVICTDLTTQGAAGCTKAVTGFEMYVELIILYTLYYTTYATYTPCIHLCTPDIHVYTPYIHHIYT